MPYFSCKPLHGVFAPPGKIAVIRAPKVVFDGTFLLGDRVFVGTKDRSGSVKFIGTTQFSAGEWLGVELDQPGSLRTCGGCCSSVCLAAISISNHFSGQERWQRARSPLLHVRAQPRHLLTGLQANIHLSRCDVFQRRAHSQARTFRPLQSRLQRPRPFPAGRFREAPCRAACHGCRLVHALGRPLAWIVRPHRTCCSATFEMRLMR